MTIHRAAAWEQLRKLGTQQLGLFTFSQAISLGLSRGSLRAALARGDLRRVERDLWAFTVAPNSWEQRARALQLRLGPAAALSHTSAAYLHRLDGFSSRPVRIDLVVPRGSLNASQRRAVLRHHHLHETRIAFDTVLISGLRVTDLKRTLFDLASCTPEAKLEHALDSANRRRPDVAPRLLALSAQHLQGGRRQRTLRHLLADRAGVVTDSCFESRLVRELRKARFTGWTPQLELRDARGHLVDADVAFPRERVGLMMDSYRFHGNKAHFLHDREVAARAIGIGWLLFSVTWEALEGDTWQRPLRILLADRSPQRRLI